MSCTINWRERMMLRKMAEQPSALDLPLRVTFFQDRFAAKKAEQQISLRDLVPLIRDTQAPYKAQLPWLKLAAFGDARGNGGSLRNDANVLEVWGVEADYDGESLTLDHARQVLTNAQVAALLYTSPSHRPEAPRWRILCPTSTAVPPDGRAALVARINGLFVGALAQESFTLSQSYYYGSVPGSAHEVALVEGKAIDLCDHLNEHAIGGAHKPATAAQEAAQPVQPALAYRPALAAGNSPLGHRALGEWCDKIRSAWDGSKHHAINEAAFAVGGLVTKQHLTEAEAWGALRDALGAILDRCKDKRAAERTLRRAFQEGMARPQDVDPPPPPEEVHPAAPFLAKVAARWAERQAKAAREQAASPAVAPELMDVPGAIGMFVAHCARTATSPQPFLDLAAGISLVGALAGRKYRTSTDLRTNISAVGIVDSGGGKDNARKQIAKCLYAAGLSRYLGGNDLASSAGLRTALTRHPSMLFLRDEFGDWLKGILGDNVSPHKAAIAADLKELYSNANAPWRGAEYADQSRQGRPREDVVDPHLCIYGTTTPEQFWGAVAGANLRDGLMARLLVFASPCHYPDEREAELVDPDPGLVTALQSIAAGAGEEIRPGGNLPMPFVAAMVSSEAAPLCTVPETPEAAAARRQLREEQRAQQRKAEGTYVTSIAGRMAENAMKLALVRAISRDPGAPVIQADDVAWGRALSQHCIDTMLREAAANVGDTPFEREVNRAMAYVRKHGPISANDLFNKGWRLPSRERDEVLRSLVDSKLLVAIEAPAGRKGGRPTIRYAVNPTPQEVDDDATSETPEVSRETGHETGL